MRIFVSVLSIVLASQLASATEDDPCFTLNPNFEPDKTVKACTAYVETSSGSLQQRGEAYASRGIALRELGQLGRSARDLEHAVQLDDQPAHQRMLAWTYREMGRNSEAEDIYSKVLAKDDHWQGWLSRCVVRQDLNKYQSALEDCNEALLRDPDNSDALFFTARAFNFLGQGDRALPLAMKATELEPDLGYYWAELAWAFYLSGNTAEAVTIAENASEKFPNDTAIAEFLDEIR